MVSVITLIMRVHDHKSDMLSDSSLELWYVSCSGTSSFGGTVIFFFFPKQYPLCVNNNHSHPWKKKGEVGLSIYNRLTGCQVVAGTRMNELIHKCKCATALWWPSGWLFFCGFNWWSVDLNLYKYNTQKHNESPALACIRCWRLTHTHNYHRLSKLFHVMRGC